MDLLTKGSIKSIMDGCEVRNPILKVLTFKTLPATTGKARYRLHLTDGVTNHSYVMLSNSLNEKIESEELQHGSIIRLDNYILKIQGERKIIVVMELTVLNGGNNQDYDLPLVGTTRNVEVAEKSIPIKPIPPAGKIKPMPINLINSYQNKWAIEGRVSQKSAIKTYHNSKGEGKLFNFLLCDSSCDVKIVAFNAEVDKFFEKILIGRTYCVSRGSVRPANATFNNTKCEFEITLNSDTEIYETVDSSNLPKMKLDFVPINKIVEKEPNTFIDVIGIVHSKMEISSVTSRTTNKEIIKRDVILVDRSGISINLTLWAENVKLLDNHDHPVLVIKGAVVKDFNGRTLSCGSNSTILINPSDIPEALTLIGWYDECGTSLQFQSSQSTTFNEVDTKQITISQLVSEADSEKAKYFSVDVLVSQIKRDNLVYKACSIDKCNKKLIDLYNGMYKCEKCNSESVDFSYRLIMNMNIIDHTGTQWVTCFQEVSELVLGRSAQDIGRMVDLEQRKELDQMLHESQFKVFSLKLRVKNETYNDETRMKVTVISGKHTNILSSINHMMNQIIIKE